VQSSNAVREPAISCKARLSNLATYANVRHQGCSILPKILAKLSEQETRFPDLLEALSMESGQSQLLSDALLEGEWLETLELTDKQEVFEHWIVRKVIR
jgi:hypothetical protein